MSDKVKLPREVAEAIETIRAGGMAEHALYDREWLKGAVDDVTVIRMAKDSILEYIDFNEDRFEADNQLMRYFKALVNGYEVEETPEDKVRDYFQQLHDADAFTDGERKRHKKILTHTLDLLNIKISGVND